MLGLDDDDRSVFFCCRRQPAANFRVANSDPARSLGRASTVAPISKVEPQGHNPLLAGSPVCRRCRSRAQSNLARALPAVSSREFSLREQSRARARALAHPRRLSSFTHPLALSLSPSAPSPAFFLAALRAQWSSSLARAMPHDLHHGPPLTDKGPFVTLAASFLIFLPPLPVPAPLSSSSSTGALTPPAVLTAAAGAAAAAADAS